MPLAALAVMVMERFVRCTACSPPGSDARPVIPCRPMVPAMAADDFVMLRVPCTALVVACVVTLAADFVMSTEEDTALMVRLTDDDTADLVKVIEVLAADSDAALILSMPSFVVPRSIPPAPVPALSL